MIDNIYFSIQDLFFFLLIISMILTFLLEDEDVTVQWQRNAM